MGAHHDTIRDTSGANDSTANFRYKHYHYPTDTPEKLDYTRLAQIDGATAMVLARSAGLGQS